MIRCSVRQFNLGYIMKSTLLAILVACSTSLPALASGYIYDCDIPSKRDRPGWIPEKINVVVQDNGSVIVVDPVILTFHEKPMPARVQRNDDRRLSIYWRLDNTVSASNEVATTFSYTAKINKQKNTITVNATPEGYSNRFHGRGKCTIRTE